MYPTRRRGGDGWPLILIKSLQDVRVREKKNKNEKPYIKSEYFSTIYVMLLCMSGANEKNK